MKTRSLALVAALLLVLAQVHAEDLVGSGRLMTEARPSLAFHALSMEGVGALTILRGQAYSIKLTMDDNLIGAYETVVQDGRLRLGFRKGSTIRNPTTVKVEVTMPSLDELRLSGACDADLGQGFSGPSLSLGLSGAGGVRGTVEYKRFALSISGSGKAKISGRAEDVAISVSGAGEVDSQGLVALRVKADLSGAAKLLVRASQSLELGTSGAAEVVYYGDPSIIQRNSGSSRVRRAGP